MIWTIRTASLLAGLIMVGWHGFQHLVLTIPWSPASEGETAAATAFAMIFGSIVARVGRLL
jgi:hypothetical protein